MADGTIRKAQPKCLYYFLKLLTWSETTNPNEEHSGRSYSVSINQLIEVLVKLGKYSNDLARETVLNAIYDGILVAVSNKTTNSIKKTNDNNVEQIKWVRLPKAKEIKTFPHDFYCFECHLPGILEHCRECTRSFHRLCYRKKPSRPNYVVPSSKHQKNPLPMFSSASESDSEEHNAIHYSIALDDESDARTPYHGMDAKQNCTLIGTIAQLNNDNSHDTNINENISPVCESKECNINSTLLYEDKSALEYIENESKNTADVLCLGEIRPPQRKRPPTATTSTISYKSEISPNEEDDTDLELCTCCRLLKFADLRNPPNVKPDELCALINYTFKRNKEWLSHDVSTYLENRKMSSNEINIITRLLFASSLKRLNDIANLIRQQGYKLLMEFLVDLLDIQHCIGVFFGPNSTEMESTKWLLRDVSYDLSEIRRCKDCFRYSHEVNSEIWFAKPCVQRHELVYAKHSGFPYWPAKVIRVLPNNKYDVRFFGGNHSRALIDVRNIKAIDSDIRSLKLGNSSAMKKALQELYYHQLLSIYPPSEFGFYADSKETEQIIQSVLKDGLNTHTKNKKNSPSKHGTLVSNIKPINNNNTMGIINNINNNNNDTNNNNNNNSNINNSYHVSNSKSNALNPSVKVKRLKLLNFANGQNNIQESFPNTRKRRKMINTDDDTVNMINDLMKEVETARKQLNDLKKKSDRLTKQNLKLKEALKSYEIERKILKRKQWCYWCLEEAIYLCCFRAAYCSEICQKRHWKESHSTVCKNQNSIALNETQSF